MDAMQGAAAKLRDGEVRDVSISYQGTFQKSGFTLLNGAVAFISIQTVRPALQMKSRKQLMQCLCRTFYYCMNVHLQ